MVLEARAFPVSLRVTAEAWMSYHNGITGAWASEVAREADLEVIWAHARQRELLSHVVLTQQGVQDHLERAHDAADRSADDRHQFVLREANV